MLAVAARVAVGAQGRIGRVGRRVATAASGDDVRLEVDQIALAVRMRMRMRIRKRPVGDETHLLRFTRIHFLFLSFNLY